MADAAIHRSLKRPGLGLAVLVMGLALLAACAGFRSGTMAAPYFAGSAPPTDQPGTIYEINQTRTLTLDDLALTITLGEDSRSSDVQVVLAVVPTSIKLGDKPDAGAGSDLTLTLDLQPGPRAVSIVPGRVRLKVAGQSVTPRQVALTGRTSRALGLTERVGVAAKDYASITMRFPLPKDTAPEQTILDLSGALGGVRGTIPPIRFKTLRWHYGYT